jgi:urea transporter
MGTEHAPQRVARAWTSLAQQNPVVAVVDALLRGTGQVMFQNNPLTGLLFLVGIFVNSPTLGVAALVGLSASTLAAWLLGADRVLLRNGLFGFNGILTGIGLAFFLEPNPALFAYIVLGGAVSSVVMLALATLLGAWDVPALTAPFVLVTWLLLFAVYQFAVLDPTERIAPAALDPAARVQTELRELPTSTQGAGFTAVNLVNGFFRGVGEVMFQDSLVSGAIFLLGILINSRISFAFAVLGSALGMLTALALGGNGFWVYHGLYGFNAVLCAIALGGLFFVLTWQSAVYAVLSTVLASVAFAAIAVLLSPLGMPALTAPFVLVTWLFLLPKAGFGALRPVPLAEVTTAEQIRATHATGQALAR